MQERSFWKDCNQMLFRKIDQELCRGYRINNPYRISRKYLESLEEKNVHQYGETPLKTIKKIGQALQLKPQDRLVELGSGRGRGAFLFSCLFQCRVTGVEQIPFFVKTARQVADQFAIPVEFLCEDFSQTSLKPYSFGYLFGSCLPDATIYRICQNIQHPMTIATVSYPLSDYDRRFQILNTIDAEFLFGNTDVYINEFN